MKLLNLKGGISNNTQKLDKCDNVIRPISVITVVKPKLSMNQHLRKNK